MNSTSRGAVTLATILCLYGVSWAGAPGDPKPVKSVEGKYFDAEGNPTYNISSNGTVDFYTLSGYRRYHAECHVCHGPDAEGSTYAPALKESLRRFDYAEFAGIVIGGRMNDQAGNKSVMPAFSDNKNVMCYLDDIYIYLRSRSTGALNRGRPEKKEQKPSNYSQNEDSCMNKK